MSLITFLSLSLWRLMWLIKNNILRLSFLIWMLTMLWKITRRKQWSILLNFRNIMVLVLPRVKKRLNHKLWVVVMKTQMMSNLSSNTFTIIREAWSSNISRKRRSHRIRTLASSRNTYSDTLCPSATLKDITYGYSNQLSWTEEEASMFATISEWWSNWFKSIAKASRRMPKLNLNKLPRKVRIVQSKLSLWTMSRHLQWELNPLIIKLSKLFTSNNLLHSISVIPKNRSKLN